jgi:hypothetical protein
LSSPAKDNDRSFPGFNFLDPDDQSLFEAIARSEYNSSGFQNKNPRRYLADKNPTQISRQLKRLRLHGLIKKIGRTYKYYLTSFGKQVITTGLKLKQLFIIPQLASAR